MNKISPLSSGIMITLVFIIFMVSAISYSKGHTPSQKLSNLTNYIQSNTNFLNSAFDQKLAH